VLADLALETEAALLVAFRLAGAFDAAAASAPERALQRILTPVAKYWLCRRMTPVAVEAMECLGGNGYVEESALARLYREAPLNGIWEGSANVICLDALRAIERSPEALEALGAEVAQSQDARARRAFDRAVKLLADRDHVESQARRVVESLALAVQAALMRRHSTDAAAEAFGAARIDAPGHALGMLGKECDAAALLARVTPAWAGARSHS